MEVELKFVLVLATTIISSVVSQSSSGNSSSSSLFVASKALSTDNWEFYKTESQPVSDLILCLARCEMHQNQWWNGEGHPGWGKKHKKELVWQIFLEKMQRRLIWIERMRGGSSDGAGKYKWWRAGERFSDPLGRNKVRSRFHHLFASDCRTLVFDMTISLELTQLLDEGTKIHLLPFPSWLSKTCRGGKGCCNRDQPCGEVFVCFLFFTIVL